MQASTTPAQYISPSGITVAFEYKEVNLSFNRRLASAEYPEYNGGDIEDLGHGIEEYSLSCLFFGTQWVQNSATFLDALREKGPGILEHPRFGRMAVLASSVSYKEDLVNAIGKSIVDVTFRKTGQQIIVAADGSLKVDETRNTPQEVVGDAQELQQLSEEVNASLIKDLEDKIAGQSINASVFNTFKAAVLKPMRVINGILSNGWRLAFSWQSAFKALEVGISGVLSAPNQIIDIIGAFLVPIQSLSTSEQLQFIGAIQQSLELSEPDPSVSISEQQAQATGTMISQTMLTMMAIELSADVQSDLPSRVAALALLDQLESLQNAYDESMHHLFQNVGLNEAFYPVAVSQNISRSFAIVKAITLNNLNQLRIEMHRILAHQMPPSEIMFLVHGKNWTDEQLIEFTTLNNLTIDELFLLESGKKVVFYG